MHLSMDAAAVQEDFGDQAQQKETMRQLVKGWKVGNFQELLDATPLESIKLSKIYQRCARNPEPCQPDKLPYPAGLQGCHLHQDAFSWSRHLYLVERYTTR